MSGNKREVGHGKMCSLNAASASDTAAQQSLDHMVTHRASVPLPLTVVFLPHLHPPPTPLPHPAWAEDSSRCRAAVVRASCNRISAPLCSSDIIFPPRRLHPRKASSLVSRLLLFLLHPPHPPPPRGAGRPASCCPLSGI